MTESWDPILEENFINLWVRPVNPVECAERWKPVQPHTAFVLPFLFEGLNDSGIYVAHDYRLPRVFGLVLKTHPTCALIKAMDICMFRPHAVDEFFDAAGDTLYAIHERSVRALLDFNGGTVALNLLGPRVAVAAKKREEISKGGIHIPQTAAKMGDQEGVIVEISRELGNRFEVGQTVLYSGFSGSEIKFEGRELTIIKDTDIIAVPDYDVATASA